jgi:acetyl-CoA carboxylase carboxyltransferase component
MTWRERLDDVERMREIAREQGGIEAVARQHAHGRLTVRERIDGVLDPGSFREIGSLVGSAERDEAGRLTGFTPGNFVLGIGKIDGRDCVVGGEDFTMAGGSPSPAGLRKSVYTEDVACRYRIPLVRLHEGAGGSVAGGGGRQGYRTLPSPVFEPPRFASVGKALATVPVASAALGAVAGLPAVRLVASHYCIMTRHTSQVMAGGPALVERALGRTVTKDELGGAALHAKSGVIDDVVEDEQAAFVALRRFLSYLPRNVWELPPVLSPGDDPDRRDDALSDIVPANRRRIYDMRRILRAVLDVESIFEIGRGHSPGIITVLGRLNGVPVGVFANDCRHAAGTMTAGGARKMRRFVELCETFHLPVITFVDEPGFMIGPESEREGTLRAGASAVLAAAMCSVPWATVIVRKSMGLGAAAHFGPDAYVLAWPSAEIGPLPVEGGVAVAFRRELAAAEDPVVLRAELEAKFAARQTPFARAEAFGVHDIIDPRETRARLCQWLGLVQPLLPELLGPTTFAFRP